MNRSLSFSAGRARDDHCLDWATQASKCVVNTTRLLFAPHSTILPKERQRNFERRQQEQNKCFPATTGWSGMSHWGEVCACATTNELTRAYNRYPGKQENGPRRELPEARHGRSQEYSLVGIVHIPAGFTPEIPQDAIYALGVVLLKPRKRAGLFLVL
jgi:hypothetical protein